MIKQGIFCIQYIRKHKILPDFMWWPQYIKWPTPDKHFSFLARIGFCTFKSQYLHREVGIINSFDCVNQYMKSEIFFIIYFNINLTWLMHLCFAACPLGYNGPQCAYPCPHPYYGENCFYKCNCTEEHCDFVFGCKPTSIASNYRPSVYFTKQVNIFIFLHYTAIKKPICGVFV